MSSSLNRSYGYGISKVQDGFPTLYSFSNPLWIYNLELQIEEKETSMKSMDEKFSELWEKRHSIEPDTDKWEPYSGFDSHLVFLKRVKDEEILNKIEEVQNDLSNFESYLKFPEYYLHITVKVWKFLSEFESSEERIEETVQELQKSISGIEKFETRLKGLNLFPDVVFIQAWEGNISRLNRKILNLLEFEKTQRDYPNFIPHYAIGTFKDKEIDTLLDKIAEYRDLDFGDLMFEDFELVRVDWKDTKFPEFETLETFHLD